MNAVVQQTSSMHVHERHATVAGICTVLENAISTCVRRHYGAISVKRSKLSTARRATTSISTFVIWHEANKYRDP